MQKKPFKSERHEALDKEATKVLEAVNKHAYRTVQRPSKNKFVGWLRSLWRWL